VDFVSARVVLVVSPLCSVRTRWACLHRSEGACLRSWIGARACNSALRALVLVSVRARTYI
jgi:hypothetical protein